MAACGAERKHVTLLKNFRSLLKNGHSTTAIQTARFAPSRPSRPHHLSAGPGGQRTLTLPDFGRLLT